VRLVLADHHCVVQGRSFAGFPLLINDDGTAVEPAQTFLWDVLTTTGRVQSPLTWTKYGRDLYDFFAFISANGLDWRAPPALSMPSVVDWYRDWSKGELGLDSNTVNSRLRLIVRFYQWALGHGHIEALPFRYLCVSTSRAPGLLAHVDISEGQAVTPSALLPQKRASIKFLTAEQVAVCMRALNNETHKLMFELMVRSGLRQVECRTFPLKYVFNPSRRRDLTPGRMIRISLSPTDMKLKYDKPRDIDVPYRLMDDLWWYAARHRQKRERVLNASHRQSSLFLTESGQQYGDTSFTDIFAALERRVGFRVRPHMLRHTFGTYTLMRLRKMGFAGEPLLYVRDRMGHSSVTTTSRYLHLINQLDAQLVLQHEEELDALFSGQVA